jgi:hypothetical protein
MQQELWMAITPGALRTRVMLMDSAGRSLLRARLPHGPRDVQAIERLSEALALWCGQPLHVVLGVVGADGFCATRRWLATFEHLTRAAPYQIEFVEALAPEDEVGFRDVRQMLTARMARR